MDLNSLLRNATGRVSRGTGTAGRRTTRGVNTPGQARGRRGGNAGVGGMLRKLLNRR